MWGRQGRNSYSSSAIGTQVATDKQGNVYIANSHWDTVVFNTDTLKNHAGFFLVKYNLAGVVQWAIQPVENKSGYSYCTSIASDNFGSIYVVGNFDDTITFGSYTFKQRQNYYSIFIVKYDSNGNVIWARQSNSRYGGSYNLVSVATDLTGNAYLTGPVVDTLSFDADTLIAPPTAYGTVFIAKYDPTGNVRWAKQSISAPNSLGSIAYAISADRNGNSYITGSFNDSIKFGAFTLKSRSAQAYIVKYDSIGNVLWANASLSPSVYGGGYPFSITTDNAGNAYITGLYLDTISFGNVSLFSSINWSTTTFLVKYDANGNALWGEQSSEISFSGIDVGSYLTHDTIGFIYLAFTSGATSSTFGGHTFTVNFRPTMYNSILCIAKLDTSGKVECGSAINSSFYPRTFNTLAVDNSGKYVYTAGTLENDTIVFAHDTLRESKDNEQAYVARWQPCEVIIDTSKYPQDPCNNLFVPNAFSPNGDNINDFECVYGSCITSLDFKIFDRWGNKVFESERERDCWDGTYNGKPMNSGVFDYELQATLENGQTISKKGSITLVR